MEKENPYTQMSTESQGIEFVSLADKCNYYRNQTNYCLPPKSYGLIMVDGKNFSTKWKNRLEKPYDKDFMEDMDEVAKYLCANIAGATFAFVQSDEISIAFNDLSGEKTQMVFDGRLNKILPVVASLATSKFNQLRLIREIPFNALYTNNEIRDMIMNFRLSEFDCKAWVVPDIDDQLAWFFYRQNDCVRNSILQLGFTHFSHKQLANKKTDEIMEKIKSEIGVDWNLYSNGEKYGRICKKAMIGENRTKWKSYEAFNFNSDKEQIRKLFMGDIELWCAD